MHPAGFEPVIRVINRPHKYALDRASSKGPTLPLEVRSHEYKHGGCGQRPLLQVNKSLLPHRVGSKPKLEWVVYIT
jgi:hypothetical protein